MEQVVEYIRLGIGFIAILVIIYGVLRGLVELTQEEWRRSKTGADRTYSFKKIRYEVGFHLILGLEFLIAADVVNTILRPTLEELAILGGIVAIRTVLSFFLGWEIRRQGQERE